MQIFMTKVAHVTGLIARIALWLSGTGLVFMTVIISAQVYSRYILNDSIMWTEPGSVMIMGWFIFLGASVGIREGYHLSFDVLLYILPEKAKLWMFSISDLVVMAFGYGMIRFGWQLAEKTMHNKLPSLGISGAFDFAPLVVGGVLVVLFTLERLARRLVGLPTPRFGDEIEAER